MHYFNFGSSASRSASVNRLNAVTSNAIAVPAAAAAPLAQYQLVLRLVEHRSPGHDVDRNAEPQEGKDDFGLDERNHQYRKLYSTTWLMFGRCARTSACVRCADRVRRLNIFAALVLQIFAANQPEAAGPPGQPEIRMMVNIPFCCSTAATARISSRYGIAVKNAVRTS